MAVRATAAAKGMAVAVALVLLSGCGNGESQRRALEASALDAVAAVARRPVAVQAFSGDGWASITLLWPEPVAVRSVTDGRSLLLRFGAPLAAPDLDALPRRLKGWVDAVNIGRDSLLMQLSLDVRATITVDGPTVSIGLEARPVDPGETMIIGGRRP